MKKLKTLKDLAKGAGWIPEGLESLKKEAGVEIRAVFVEDLRGEAIKWIKELGHPFPENCPFKPCDTLCPFWEEGSCFICLTRPLFKHFFNIKEEEIK